MACLAAAWVCIPKALLYTHGDIDCVVLFVEIRQPPYNRMSCQGNDITVLPMHRYAVALAAKDESWRWGFHSCNGLSAGADVRAWKDPHLWEDVMATHAEAPIHAFVGGGDQIYNDALWSTPGMQAWLHLDDSEVRTQRLLTAISVLPKACA